MFVCWVDILTTSLAARTRSVGASGVGQAVRAKLSIQYDDAIQF